MEKIDKEFIEFYKQIGKEMGLDNLSSTIFAKLYIEPKEIPMEDLATTTGYSLASISNKVNSLERMGFVQKTTHPEQENSFYTWRKTSQK